MPEKRCVSTLCPMICMSTPLNYQVSCARNLVFFLIYITLAFIFYFFIFFFFCFSQNPIVHYKRNSKARSIANELVTKLFVNLSLYKTFVLFHANNVYYCQILHCTSCMSNL